MNEQEQKRVTTVLLSAFEMYRQPKPSATVHALWIKLLNGYSVSEIEQAFAKHLATSKWMPAPSDILDLIKPDLEIEAQAAYNDFREALIRVGAYRSVCFKNPATMTTVSLMGNWGDLCHTPTEKLDFMRKNFIETYIEISKRDNVKPPELLKGIFKDDSPVMIESNKQQLKISVD